MISEQYRGKKMKENDVYNIYCDESCHLEKDNQKVMVIGAVWCPLAKTKGISKELKNIKKKHKLSDKFELKWTKISPSKIYYYLEVIEYFFNEEDLHFRAIIIPDKTKLRHKNFQQDHNIWYYKMFFLLLNAVFEPRGFSYRIYLDIKDTCSGRKIEKLHQVLCNKNYDFSRDIISKVQAVRSDEVEMLQVTDLLIGSLSYINRGLNTSKAKLELIRKVQDLSGYSLQASTLLKENKFNLFFWTPKEF
jgi:hypothetical protein